MKKLFALLLVGCAVCLQGCDKGGKSVPNAKYPMMTSEWVQIIEKDGKRTYLNIGDGSLLGGEQKRFWLKEEKGDGSYTLMHYQADCINNKLKMLAGSKYNNKKESVNAMSWEEDNVKWEYIIPETVGNVYRNAVCSGWRPEVKSEKEK